MTETMPPTEHPNETVTPYQRLDTAQAALFRILRKQHHGEQLFQGLSSVKQEITNQLQTAALDKGHVSLNIKLPVQTSRDRSFAMGEACNAFLTSVGSVPEGAVASDLWKGEQVNLGEQPDPGALERALVDRYKGKIQQDPEGTDPKAAKFTYQDKEGRTHIAVVAPGPKDHVVVIYGSQLKDIRAMHVRPLK
ncbi:MAG: hypothetical protein ACOCXQ_02360 [Patescibacteria group bacterium]